MGNTFSISEAISTGWEHFKINIGFWVGSLLIVLVVQLVFSGVAGMLKGVAILATLVSLAGVVVGIILRAGLMFAALKEVDGQKPAFEDLMAPMPQFVALVIAGIAVSVIVGIGAIFLIIPGIYLAIRLGFSMFNIIDQNSGPFEAMAFSWRVTQAHAMQLFLFGLALVALNIVGALLLGVGLLATGPISVIAAAYAYRKITGTTRQISSEGSAW